MPYKQLSYFHHKLLAWYDQCGRKNLPWQNPRHPYRVWISEIMLQQTQVQTVIPFFNRFMKTFPTLTSLASAAEDDVLALWSGLGYYSRARHIHQAAKMIVNQYEGHFPDTIDKLIKLPGIGESTAAAIVSLAYDKKAAILDGNVIRVLARHFLISGLPTHSTIKKQFWEYAKACLPETRHGDYSQAIMDLGATCCTRQKPNCAACPLQSSCLAYKNKVIADFPAKKAQRILPVKNELFLLLYLDNHCIYLERRPPTGIWGGLWCLPSIDPKKCPLTHIKNTYGMDSKKREVLPSFKHSFSHYHLEIQAEAFQVSFSSVLVQELPGQWITISDLKNYGIAKPIQKIIDNLALTAVPTQIEDSGSCQG